MGTLIKTSIMITLLLTLSLLVLTATEAHPWYGPYGGAAVPPAPISSGPAVLPHVYGAASPQYGQYGGASVYYPPSNPALLQPSATAPLYSAVDVGRKKMKAAEEYKTLVDNLDN